MSPTPYSVWFDFKNPAGDDGYPEMFGMGELSAIRKESLIMRGDILGERGRYDVVDLLSNSELGASLSSRAENALAEAVAALRAGKSARFVRHERRLIGSVSLADVRVRMDLVPRDGEEGAYSRIAAGKRRTERDRAFLRRLLEARLEESLLVAQRHWREFNRWAVDLRSGIERILEGHAAAHPGEGNANNGP